MSSQKHAPPFLGGLTKQLRRSPLCFWSQRFRVPSRLQEGLMIGLDWTAESAAEQIEQNDYMKEGMIVVNNGS